jgi:hypothetical protein
MTIQKQSFTAQIIVAVVVGLISSLGTGVMTTYVLTNKFDKKLDAYIIYNSSESAQVRRDIARIEQDNIARARELAAAERSMGVMQTNVAVIKSWVDEQKVKGH